MPRRARAKRRKLAASPPSLGAKIVTEDMADASCYSSEKANAKIFWGQIHVVATTRSKMTRICKHYQAGRCLYADRCSFLHVDCHQYDTRASHLKYPTEPVSPELRTPPVRPPGTYRRPQVCRFFMLGRCVYGDGCSYLHPQQNRPETRVWVKRDEVTPPNRSLLTYHGENSPSKPVDRFHFRRSTDEGTVKTAATNADSSTAAPGFSFRQAVEEAASGGQTARGSLSSDDFGYSLEEVYSTAEELGEDDCAVYDAETEYFDVDSLPLFPPTAQQCLKA
nr:unnamed protein product [Spirometra erinaceieuropaei]